MTLGNRIKAIRKKDNLTLEKFGERIDLKKSALSQYEHDTATPSDRTIRSICREFHVNEHWLRTGEGEMSAPPDDDEILIARLAEKRGLNARDTEIVRLYLELTPEGRAIVRRHIAQAILEAMEDAQSGAEPLTDEEIAEKTAAFNALLKGAQEIERTRDASIEPPQSDSGTLGADAAS